MTLPEQRREAGKSSRKVDCPNLALDGSRSVDISDGIIDLTQYDEMTSYNDELFDLDDTSNTADHEIIDLTKSDDDDNTEGEQDGRVEDIPMSDVTELTEDMEVEDAVTTLNDGKASNDTNRNQATSICCKPGCSNPPARGLNNCRKCLSRAAQEWKASVQQPPNHPRCSLSGCIEKPMPGRTLCLNHEKHSKSATLQEIGRQKGRGRPRQRHRRSVRQRIKENATEKLCDRARCLSTAMASNPLCEQHWRKHQRHINSGLIQRNNDQKKAIRDRWIANGSCGRCGLPRADSKLTCARCRERKMTNRKRTDAKDVCATCGRLRGAGATRCGGCSSECSRGNCKEPPCAGYATCVYHMALSRFKYLSEKCRTSQEDSTLTVTMSEGHVSLAITPKREGGGSADHAATNGAVELCTDQHCKETPSVGFRQCTYHRAWLQCKHLIGKAAIEKASLAVTSSSHTKMLYSDMVTIAIVPKRYEVRAKADGDIVMDGSNNQSLSEDDEMSDLDLLGNGDSCDSVDEHTIDVEESPSAVKDPSPKPGVSFESNEDSDEEMQDSGGLQMELD
ncbi:hypothetical protein GGR57DRAFT_507450 [Xylariaceae sp. FL1272]|nr:hypothetical protein GGR57DRAFT_507450 [Xylariaceae sp. FL1272]